MQTITIGINITTAPVTRMDAIATALDAHSRSGASESRGGGPIRRGCFLKTAGDTYADLFDDDLDAVAIALDRARLNHM